MNEGGCGRTLPGKFTCRQNRTRRGCFNRRRRCVMLKAKARIVGEIRKQYLTVCESLLLFRLYKTTQMKT
jgi:hypothetical protein